MQVNWGLVAIQAVVTNDCGLHHFLGIRAMRSALTGLLSFLAALCLILTIIAAVLRQVSSRHLGSECMLRGC